MGGRGLLPHGTRQTYYPRHTDTNSHHASMSARPSFCPPGYPPEPTHLGLSSRYIASPCSSSSPPLGPPAPSRSRDPGRADGPSCAEPWLLPLSPRRQLLPWSLSSDCLPLLDDSGCWWSSPPPWLPVPSLSWSLPRVEGRVPDDADGPPAASSSSLFSLPLELKEL